MPTSKKPKKFKKELSAIKKPEGKIKTRKVVESTVGELKKETQSVASYLFGKQVKIIKSKQFWTFFIQSLLVTGVLLLLILIFSFVIEINSYTLFSVKDTYSPSALPVISEKATLGESPLAYVIYEKDSRTVIDSRNENNRFSPASTAKLMTALIVMEHYNLRDSLVASHIASVEGSKMGLFENERITVKNLLYGLLLPSGNDAAYVLSQNYPGGQKQFVKRMNEKAQELKLSNTHFEDPAGYEDNNYTTPSDLVHLASFAISDPTIQDVVMTKKKIVYDTTGAISHNLSNLNELLYVKGVTGIKTGFTEEAGGVLTTSYVFGGKTYVMVVMKSDDRFADTRKLLEEINTVTLTSF